MKFGILASALAVALGTVCAANAAQPDPNRMLVTYKPGMQSVVETKLLKSGAQVHRRLSRQHTISVSLPPQALLQARKDKNVLRIERDYPRYPMAQTVPYGITTVQAPDTVAAGADGTGIKVCVIDSGINADHEDFAGISMSGYASNSQSWNSDTCGHGTHVAGTIAAVDNSVGVVGVSPGKVSLHIIKVFDGPSCGWSYSSTLIDAANRCASAGAKVINMSLGGGGASNTERDAFANLLTNGVLSIAAAGNDGNSTKSYPASYDAVMSVAATDDSNAKAGFSQFNDQVEIAAPGVDVLSTYPTASSTLAVDSVNYQSSALDGTIQGSVLNALVDGGRCASAGSWSGKVVLCERGDISFGVKVTNVTSGGGTGAIVYNNVPGGFSGTLGGSSTIPAISISQRDGQFLVANKLGINAAISTVPAYNVSSYGVLSGTSMATPHVAGVAALVWSAAPGAAAADVRNAMTSTAIDLGAAGRDVNYGYGLVQALDATSALLGASTPSALTVRVWVGVRGKEFRLAWQGRGTSFDVWRNDAKVATVGSTKSYVDRPGIRAGHGVIKYRVCNAGTDACTADLTVNY